MGKHFCGDCGAALVAPTRAPSDVQGLTSPLPVSLVERCSLTIMFCDLVGSTELSTRIDPEDFRDVISACHRQISNAVQRYGGFIARYIGDAVMAFFGYPRAHEDDAERAVHAALAATEAIASLRLLDGTYQPCILTGIATGIAVVGDLLGSGTDVAGETPNLAARLHDLAGRGDIVIASSTRRLLGHRFECRRHGEMRLKGFKEPVGVFQVLGMPRLDALARHRRLAQPLPMVGREPERQTLLGCWSRVLSAEGQVVLLTGEAGIGKSRLLAALREDTAHDDPTRLRYFCSPFHTTSALQPVVAQLERAARFAPEDSAERRLSKLRDALEEPAEAPVSVDAIADLLSLQTAGRETPQARKDRTLASLLAQLRALAEHRPVLLIVEDAHWADPTSRELLDMAVDLAANLPIMIVVATRPEYEPAWRHRDHVTVLPVNRLDRDIARALINALLRDRTLPHPVVEQIIDRSDGVPLYIEEVTKAVLENAALMPHAIDLAATGRTLSIDIPETLNASLMARLGPPSVMREVALIGATIGREFSYEMMMAVSDQPEPVLRQALTSLTDTELVQMRNRPPHSVYSFKHALVRDAAYGLLLRERRRELHARIAAVLRTRFPDVAERQPELLAQHHASAGEYEQALVAWIAAARRASER